MSNYKFEISEVNNDSWIFNYEKKLKVDRTSETIADLLEKNNIKWSVNNYSADMLLFKENLSKITPVHIAKKFLEITKKFNKKYFNVVGEPVELTPLSWAFNNKDVTLSVAPGDKFQRFYFASEWQDPQIESWKNKLDKVVYIGRPTPERIKNVQMFIDAGVDIDIYSKQSWPFSQWKGFIEGGVPGEYQVLKKYKYRFVNENSYTHLYHSEKLFNAIRAGVVPFYMCDPQLEVPFIKDLYISPTIENIKNRNELSGKIIENINTFMFSKNWEMYSIKNQYEQIIKFSEKILNKD
jgi:hypothetical protein